MYEILTGIHRTFFYGFISLLVLLSLKFNIGDVFAVSIPGTDSFDLFMAYCFWSVFLFIPACILDLYVRAY